MNNLSWLLYFSELAGNFQLFLAIGGFFVTIGAIFGYIVYHFAKANDDGNRYSLIDHPEYWVPFWKNKKKYLLIIGISMMVISNIMPSGTTIKMIAASQYGEYVIKDPGSQEVLKALKDKILRELSK